MPQLGTGEWLIILLLIVVLFGAKRLPEAARGLGRSLRIFKAETKGLVDPQSSAVGEGPAPTVRDLPAAQEAQAPVTPPTNQA